MCPETEADKTDFTLAADRGAGANSVCRIRRPCEVAHLCAPGSNVTRWFAEDPIRHLKHRCDTEHSVWSPSDVLAFMHEAADLMSYKWLDFSAPSAPRGSDQVPKGSNTVVVGDLAMAKKQLGNIAFMFVPTIDRPNGPTLSIGAEAKGFADWWKGDNHKEPVLGVKTAPKVKDALEEIARIGYSVEPYYKAPAFGNFEDPPVYRADNLAAFAVGRDLGWTFLDELARDGQEEPRKKIKSMLCKKNNAKNDATVEKNVQILTDRLEKLLNRKVGNGGKDLANVVDSFRKFQPISNAPPITLDALTTTPDYGGFNFRSLAGSDKAPAFSSMDNSIAAADRMFKEFKRETGHDKNDDRFKRWRAEKYQQWTVPGNGFPLIPHDK